MGYISCLKVSESESWTVIALILFPTQVVSVASNSCSGGFISQALRRLDKFTFFRTIIEHLVGSLLLRKESLGRRVSVLHPAVLAPVCKVDMALQLNYHVNPTARRSDSDGVRVGGIRLTSTNGTESKNVLSAGLRTKARERAGQDGITLNRATDWRLPCPFRNSLYALQGF